MLPESSQPYYIVSSLCLRLRRGLDKDLPSLEALRLQLETRTGPFLSTSNISVLGSIFATEPLSLLAHVKTKIRNIGVAFPCTFVSGCELNVSS